MTELEKLIEETKIKIEEINNNKIKSKGVKKKQIRKELINAFNKASTISEKELRCLVGFLGRLEKNKLIFNLAKKCEHVNYYIKNGLNESDVAFILKNNDEFKIHRCAICGEITHVKHSDRGFNKTCYNKKCSSILKNKTRIESLIRAVIEQYNLDIKNENDCRVLFENIKTNEGWFTWGFELIKNNSYVKNAKEKGLSDKDIAFCLANKYELELIKCAVCGKILHIKRLGGKMPTTCKGRCSMVFNRDKIKKACMEKMGVEYPFKSIDFQQSINSQSAKGKLENYFNKNICNNLDVKPLFSVDEWKGWGSEYNSSEYKWKCVHCKKIFTTSSGKRPICPFCCQRYYIEQQSVIDFIKNIFFNIEIKKNDRKQISPHELDIFIPSLNIGIEYNGDYWHSTKRGKSKFVHYNKYKKCLNKNIKLITIPQNLWLSEKRELIENKLKEVISGNAIELKDTNFSFINYSDGVDILNKLSLEVINSVSNKDFFISNNSRDFILVIGRPFFNKRFQWEIKFCSNFNEQYFNSALKIFEDEMNPRSIVLYYDASFGNIDKISSFEYLYHSKPIGVFRNPDISRDFFDYELEKVPKEYFNKDKNFQDKTRNLFYRFNRVFNVGYQVFKKIYVKNEENKP